MEFSSANSYTPRHAGYTHPDHVSAVDMPSPLLLKRLQQQKKKLAEAKAEAKKNTLGALEGTRQWPGAQQTPGTPEQTSPKYTPNHSSSAARSPRPESSGKTNRRSQETNRRIEGMGVREMDQFLSKVQKENFDLKLSLYHLREKVAKNEAEISSMRAQLTRANTRNDELVQLNEKLENSIRESDLAIDGACKIIAGYEDRLADCDLFHKPLQDNGRGVISDKKGHDVTSPDSASTLISHSSLSCGVSPFAPQGTPSLSTFRGRFYQDGRVPCSPCPSTGSNLIDLSTPCSTRSSASLIRAAFMSSSERHTPACTSLASRSSFMDRCTSALSENPQAVPSPSRSSSIESLPSVISESSLSMYGGRDNDNPTESGTDDDDLVYSGSDEHAQFMDKSLGAQWSSNCAQQLVDSLTPSRRPSPSRRSPRTEIMEFRDKQEKQDKQRDKMSLGQDNKRNAMPPTPESISPSRACEFNSSEDDDDEANCGISLVSPTEEKVSKGKTVNQDVRRSTIVPKAVLAPSPLNKGDVEIAGSKPKSKRSLKIPVGQGIPVAQGGKTFGDITNMRDTHKRLGYGFGDHLGNRNNPKKVVGLNLCHSVRKNPVSGSSKKESPVIAPVKPVAAHGLPVRSRIKMTTPQPDHNLSTPPYTPNSESTTSGTATRGVVKKKNSWEGFNSGSNSNSDMITSRSTHNTPYTLGTNSIRRNSVAAAAATTLSATLNRRVNDPVHQTKRMSGIPSLVRTSSLKVGTKDRSR